MLCAYLWIFSGFVYGIMTVDLHSIHFVTNLNRTECASMRRRVLLVCEQELMWLEMSLNVKKSSCIRIGARYSAKCCNIVNIRGQELSWATKLRYLGVFIEAASSFKCSLDNAKQSFCRFFNSIFGRVGRVTSNEVILQLLKSKCLPVFYYYGMEACSLRNSQ